MLSKSGKADHKMKLYTAISGGMYKGKKLMLPPLFTTRSTKSILKESFFNTVSFEIVDALFVEVFGGSGSMGLEAISRGSRKAFFIEKDKKAYSVLLENCKNIDEKKTEVFFGDSFIVFDEVLKEIKDRAYFYFDPPFEHRKGMENIYEKVYSLIKKIPCNSVKMIAIEHMSSLNTPDFIGVYKKKKTKKFGKSALSYFIGAGDYEF
jgi:16S rRNA (guanine(966)-N(2))-methyltransferase RsmD